MFYRNQRPLPEPFKDRLERVSNATKYKNWKFVISEIVGEMFIHVEFIAPDSNGGKSGKQLGRKWYVESTTNDCDIIRTLHKAVLAAVEHEVDEFFTYDGVKIFDPHKAI